MLKLKIISVGKTKETWLNDAIDEYKKRLSPVLQIEFILAKNDANLIEQLKNESQFVCLDSTGDMFTSEQFSKFVQDQFISNGSRLTLVIGGPEGLPNEIKKKSPLISLSLMTMTHQMVRLILLEQIYRAFEIAKGSKYHK
jgi:23S rRNA (pseudouridine1915-N3)-methyltransferase